MQWLYTGFRLVIVFIELLQLVTTSKDYAVTVLHTTEVTKGHTTSSKSVTASSSRCLSNGFSTADIPCLSYHLLTAASRCWASAKVYLTHQLPTFLACTVSARTAQKTIPLLLFTDICLLRPGFCMLQRDWAQRQVKGGLRLISSAASLSVTAVGLAPVSILKENNVISTTDRNTLLVLGQIAVQKSPSFP
jgi:hypothetical protein